MRFLRVQFQSLIGRLQTGVRRCGGRCPRGWFQSLIGRLQTLLRGQAHLGGRVVSIPHR